MKTPTLSSRRIIQKARQGIRQNNRLKIIPTKELARKNRKEKKGSS